MLHEIQMVHHNIYKYNKKENETSRKRCHDIHCVGRMRANDANGTVARNGNHPDNTFVYFHLYIFPNARTVRMDRGLTVPEPRPVCYLPRMVQLLPL